MAFTETIKLIVKRKAHFSCSLCHALGVEVHHLVPQAEGGPDTEDNAVPLCPSCHETYGGNPEKRKFIREARTFWYEICEKRFSSTADRLEKILHIVQETSSKEDVGKVLEQIAEFQQTLDNSVSQVLDRERYISQIDQMQQRLISIDQELQAKDLTLQQTRKREGITHLAIQIAAEIIQSSVSAKDSKTTEAYGRASGALIKMGNLPLEKFVQTFQDAFKGGPVPEDPVSEVLYYLTIVYKNFYQLTVSIEASSSVIPTMLEEYDKSPEQPVKELQKVLAKRIRAET